MKKINTIILFVLLNVSFLANTALAEDISFTATVSQNPLVFGESAQLRLSVEGTQDVSALKLPAIDGLETQYLGPSRQVSMVNGKVNSSIAFTYSVFPTRTGSFTIPALRLTYKGEEYVTEPIAMKVLESAEGSASSEGLKLEDRIYLDMKVDQTEVYVNQGVPVRFLFFVTGLNVRQISAPEFSSKGFLIEEFAPRPQQGQIVKNGLRFNVVEFKTVVYPTRAGDLSITPARMDVNVEMPSEGRKKQRNGLFSDAFFDHFFTNQMRTLTLKSNGANLKVKPLPEKGKPKKFSNAVGEFNFGATVSPKDVNAGDPITVRVNLKGEGNLKAIDMPRFSESNNFRTYDASVSEKDGAKILEQVLIPKSDKVKKVPKLDLSYFDPRTASYKTKTIGPFPINVRKGVGSTGINIVGLGEDDDVEAEEEKFGEDIVFIKEDVGRLSKRGTFLYSNPAFYTVVLVLIIAFGVLFRQRGMQLRLRTDKSYERRYKAKKVIKKELNKIEKLVNQGDPLLFYGSLAQTLQRYVADVLGVPVGIVTVDGVGSRSELSELPQEIAEQIKATLSECDQVRFASVEVNETSMQTSLKRLKVVVEKLENYEA